MNSEQKMYCAAFCASLALLAGSGNNASCNPPYYFHLILLQLLKGGTENQVGKISLQTDLYKGYLANEFREEKRTAQLSEHP